jgi:hypothetical protein
MRGECDGGRSDGCDMGVPKAEKGRNERIGQSMHCN